jgi:signal transduction histidine kinase
MLLIGAGVAIVSLLGSWWLSGRLFVPEQRAWQRQQTFVANASHELRTPLTLIRLSAQMARQGLQDGDGRRQLLDDVIGETDHMTKLADDLLLLSRLDTAQLVLDLQEIDLADVIDNIQTSTARLTANRVIHLTTQTERASVRGDATRLRQVMLILVDNALSHTPPGGAVSIVGSEHNRLVTIVVSDTGEGIAAEHLPHVFERFYKASNAGRHDGRGAGLGLSIAKSLVEAHGGTIEIRSKVGVGTEVCITLPASDRIPVRAPHAELPPTTPAHN